MPEWTTVDGPDGEPVITSQPDAEQRAEALRLAEFWVTKASASKAVLDPGSLLVARALLAAKDEVAELRGYRDEAERLRLIEHRKMYDEIEMLEARVKRLEEALSAIATGKVPPTYGGGAYSHRSLARAALSEPTEGE